MLYSTLIHLVFSCNLVMKNELVVKSNRLIEASYKLDLIEQRVILMAIVEARNTGKGINSNDFLEVRAADFANLFDTDVKNSYIQLRTAADSLFSRWILLRGLDEATGKSVERKTRWVSAVDYIEGAGLIRIQFAGVVVPYITRLESGFTSYRIGAVSRMTSSYAIRLYEILIQWGNIGTREVTVDWLRTAIGVESNDYSRMSDFRRWVLDVSISQVNDFSDINVSYSQRKTGRSFTHLTFFFQPKHIKKVAAQSEKRPKNTQKSHPIDKAALPVVKEKPIKAVKVAPRLNPFLALDSIEQEQLRMAFASQLSSPLRELWKGSKDKNPEFKPMFTESFLAMLKEYGLFD